MQEKLPAADMARCNSMTTQMGPGLSEGGPGMESSRRMDAPRLHLTQEPVADAGSFGVRQAGGVLERAQRIADTLREQAEYENDLARDEAERVRVESERLRTEAEATARSMRAEATSAAQRLLNDAERAAEQLRTASESQAERRSRAGTT
jgi:hypothetical protein